MHFVGKGYHRISIICLFSFTTDNLKDRKSNQQQKKIQGGDPQLRAVGFCQPHSLIGSIYLHNKDYNYIVELNTNLANYGPPPCLYIWMDCFHTLFKKNILEIIWFCHESR